MTEKSGMIFNFVNDAINDMPKIVNRKITYKNQKFNHRLEFFEITKYIDDFLNGDFYNRFVVLPGIRGVGKSTILFQIYEYLLNEKNIPADEIIYVSCEDLNDLVDCSIREMVDNYLNNYFNTTLSLFEGKLFLLIDESQYDKNWSLSGKIIHDKCENIFMIFTGSSALNLEYNADAARRMVKKTITPINYNEHINLNYKIDCNSMSNSLKDLLFKGEIDDAVYFEDKVNHYLLNCHEYDSKDWNNYFKFGGFPKLYDNDSIERLVQISRKVINTDMIMLKDFSHLNQVNANRILRYLAFKDPGNTSHAKLSKFLQTSSLNVKNILDVLELTHLIFHIEPYSVSSKRISKSWNYYFATSSLRNALAISIGDTKVNSTEYNGNLLENLVASLLFNLSFRIMGDLSLYYDPAGKNNVDFLVQLMFDKPIPIEVGWGKKDKRQVKSAINRFGADYGIVISNKTHYIKREDDVIFIPPRTFSFI